MKNIPAGNKIYLTCSGCGKDPLELGRRTNKTFSKAPERKVFENWFEHHSTCFGPPDKWRLGYEHAPNYDAPSEVVKAVARELQ